MTLFADAPALTAIGNREQLELLKGRFRAVSERAEELAKANSALRQRELAAKERAAELELANQALRKGVAGLGQLNDLSTFLEEMLKAAVATAGAHAGGVVLLDEVTQTYRVHPLLHARGGFEPPNTTLTNTFPINPTFRAILDAVKTSSTAWLLDPNDPRIHPEFIKLHEFEGSLAVGHIPMCAGDRLLGVLGLGFATREPEFDKDYPLLRSLADQMAMAVEMVRLSEQARSAAIAREREEAFEQRVAELERVNELLRESAQILAQARTPDEICELYLLQAVKAMQGTAGGLLEVVEGTEHRFVALVQGNQIVADRGWEQLPIVTQNQEITRQDKHGVMARLLKGEDVWFPVDDEFADWAPASAAYHRSRGNAAIVMWPFHVGHVVKGNIGIAFAHTVPPSESQRQTLRALSSQASLALELNAMAKEVENAAIAREREKAVQERAIELAQANEALTTRSQLLSVMAEVSTSLLRSGDFVQSLCDALRVIGETIGLSRVLLLERREILGASGLFEHRVTAEWCAPGIRTHAECGVAAINDTDAGQVLADLEAGRSSWYRIEVIQGPIRHILERLGIKATGCTPVFVGGQYAGAITFDDCAQARTWEEAQVDALMVAANAIAAALQARHDAERLASEREKAAQEQAAELVKANHALRSSVDDLVTQTTTEGILTCLLKQAVDISGANSGAILRRIAGSEFEYVTIYADGVVRTSEEILAAGTNTEMRLASRLDPTGHFTMLSKGEAKSRDIEDEALARHLLRSTAFHREAGTKRIYDFPYQVAGQVFGYLGLAFADSEPPSETVQETIKALATQVGLALEFRRISDQVERAAIVEERNKFARDLHDTLAQGFAAILMQLGAAEQAGDIPTTLLPYLDRVDRLARAGLAEARSTVSELRTSERIKDALPKRLFELSRRMESTFGYLIQLRITGTLRALPFVVEDELYLIAQESLTNAMKHAEASEVKLELEFCDRGLRLKVKDNGRGFSAEERSKPDHFGLQTMQERSQRINAKVTIISEPGFGTEILILWNEPLMERS